jgi:hypothetical protein
MTTLLYDIGYKVGKQLRKQIGLKQPITITYDPINGDDSSEGIDQPTSNFLQALTTAERYLEATIKIQNSETTGIMLGTVFYINNHLDFQLIVDGENRVDLTFYALDTENAVICNFWITNSNVVFENLNFIIPSHIEPPSVGYISSIPFIITNSVVKFYRCSFTCDDIENLTFVYANHSTIILDSCEFIDHHFTFCVSPETPSLLTTLNTTIPEHVVLKHKDSYWIKYGTGES